MSYLSHTAELCSLVAQEELWLTITFPDGAPQSGLLGHCNLSIAGLFLCRSFESLMSPFVIKLLGIKQIKNQSKPGKINICRHVRTPWYFR